MTSPSRARRDRERREMRARLLDTARLLATEEGWQAVTIRRIADRLEYTSPILYQHFAGKDALLRELMLLGFREVAARLRATPPDLTALATAYWTFAFETPELYQAMNGLDGVPFATADTPPEAREAFVAFRDLLIAIATENSRTLPDPEAATDTLWACFHGHVTLAMSARLHGGPPRARTLILAVLPALFTTLSEPA